MARWKVAGINFDHMHMGDQLRLVTQHPDAELVGIWHREVNSDVQYVQQALKIPMERFFAGWEHLLTKTKPDLVILCPATAEHALWVEKVAPFGTHIMIEKPFASNLAEADRMIAAMASTGKMLAINWPLRWYPSHATAKRLVSEGRIGDVLEVHYYDGNRGPVRHGADKVTKSEPSAEEKLGSWFYQKRAGGGSLQDYLGYGTTLGTWYHNGRKPIDVTTQTFTPAGLEVDEHSITICRYEVGLSKFETRWGTFTDPWTLQPQPKCGFVIVGSGGNISSYDFENTVRVQDHEHPAGIDIPVDAFQPPVDNSINYMLDCIARNVPVEGPLSVEMSRIGQQIVDSAALSAEQGRTVALVG